MLPATKTLVPPPNARAIPRGRLRERLDDPGPTVVLVSAPAGSGKTSLLSAWARAAPHPVAWLALDPEDDDPSRFWACLVDALRLQDPGLASAGALLRSPSPPSGRALASVIVADLAARGRPLAIVLDDLHVVTAGDVHEGLVLLAEHLPPRTRLMVTTRADPPWPLARMRASGRMDELRAADLRFTADEAARFLAGSAVDLHPADLSALISRTEGWVAGMQMAALSLRGAEPGDAARRVREFAGGHRFVLDYFAEEVLDGQRPQTRSFLLRTSILGQLCGGLCDAVTGSRDGARMLASLAEANLFTEALDPERRWYRYHRLFADVLRSHLGELPEDVSELHRRASAWHEAHGLVWEAAGHALEAGDVRCAAGLMTRTARGSFQVGHQARLLERLDRFSPEIVAGHPVLAVAGTWARFVTGDWLGVAPALADATRAVDACPDQRERSELSAQLDGVRAWLAYQAGDLEGCVGLAGDALAAMPADGLIPRRVIGAARGYALLLLGDTDAARAVAAETAADSRRAGDALTECLAVGLGGQADLVDGRLVAAARGLRRAIATGTIGDELLPSASIAQVALGEVLREQDRLEDAERALRAGIAGCRRTSGLAEWTFEGHVTLARTLLARGDDDAARAEAEEAEVVLASQIEPEGMERIVERALGYRVRLQLALGEPERAAALLGPADPSAGPASDAVRARVMTALGEADDAARIAQRGREGVSGGREVGAAIDLTLALALARDAVGRRDEAVALVDEALRRGAPDGYVRAFVDGGPAMSDLLRRASPGPRQARHLARVARALDDGAGGPVERLSARELALLRMLAVGRSNGEIARELVLSVNTVKWHARNAYRKLGVDGRGRAVARARQLGLI